MKDYFSTNPIINYLLCACVIVCVGLLLFGAINGRSRDELEIELLTLGVVVIFITVLRTENAIAITTSIFIVGTVVAGDRFLLSFAALTGQTNAEGLTFVQDLYGNELQYDNIIEDPERFAERIVSLIEDRGSDQAETIVENVISEARVQRLAQQVQRDGSAITPLRWMFENPSDFSSRASEFQNEEFFERDMLRLESLGLAEVDTRDILNSQLLPLGERVAEVLFENAVDRAIDRIEQDTAVEEIIMGNVAIINHRDEINTIDLSQEQPAWRRFDLETRSFVLIETISESLDTTLRLYNVEKSELEFDDDSGEDANAQIATRLDPGQYLLKIDTFGSQMPDPEDASVDLLFQVFNQRDQSLPQDQSE